MDLPSHFVFGIAVGFVFFGRPEVALLIGLGALLPDLDREYWFIGRQAYRQEQYHRALFHNVFIIILTYLISPFISLGIFLHVLQDSFTTSRDRGCEWFYPVSRLVKRGLYDEDGNKHLDPDEHIYFFQEDQHGFLEYIELDIREEGPVPWRRTYGPAQNSSLLDRGFLFGSIAVIFIWLFVPDNAHFNLLLNQPITNYVSYIIGYISVAILFTAGELDRKDKPLRLGRANFVKYPIFGAGIILLCYWLALFWPQLVANFESILTNWISVFLGVIVVVVVSLAVIKWQTRDSKIAIV
jgi:hypothetical protein